MQFFSEEINRYLIDHTSEESEVLKKLNRETHLKVLLPQMISDHLQGAFLSMLSCMVQPKRILEIGTFTGYSAICLCEGLSADGILHTIDINEELKDMQDRYFGESGTASKIVRHTGNALDIIPNLNETFDMVFIDADKENYPNYYDLVFDKVRKGGFILADNVLWSGKVVEENPDKDTSALMEYSHKVHSDHRVKNVMVPMRDGVLMARKL